MRSSVGKHTIVLLLTGLILLAGSGPAPRAQAPGGGPRQTRLTPRPPVVANGARITSATRVRTRNKRTSGTLRSYTSRPLMAVGDVLEVNLTSRTITVAINPKLSTLPPSMATVAQRVGELDKITQREFPARRTFPLGLTTSLLDERLLDKLPAQRSDTEHERLQKITIKLTDFHPGERVSVLFITHPGPALPPTVLNVKKQNPARTDYSAIYRPLPIQQRTLTADEVTSQIRANAVPTTGPLPRGTEPLRRNDGAGK